MISPYTTVKSFCCFLNDCERLVFVLLSFLNQRRTVDVLTGLVSGWYVPYRDGDVQIDDAMICSSKSGY